MAANWTAKDANGANFTISSTEVSSGIHANNVRVCDATAANFMPTMDAVARPGFVKVTDGTNTAPTMDAAARAGFQKITDGTNTMPTMDAAARAGYVSPVAATTGGCSMSKTVAGASTNATSVKGSAGTVYGIQVNNVNAAVRYLKLYDKATAPTIGTDTPVKTIAIPAGANVVVPIPACGLAFALGIGFGLTTEATDAGTTGVSANEHVVNIDYK